MMGLGYFLVVVVVVPPGVLLSETQCRKGFGCCGFWGVAVILCEGGKFGDSL